MIRHKFSRLLDSLDNKNDLAFLVYLYVIRWLLLIPVIVIAHFISTDSQLPNIDSSKTSAIGLLFLFVLIVIISPLLETLFECTLPYFIISRFRRRRGKRMPMRSWSFIITSALLMVLLHPMLSAILPALITGITLAYCYNHFAPRGSWTAIITTTIFHGSINIVGWFMIVF